MGVTFVGGSITSVGAAKANEHNFKLDDPLRPLYVANPGGGPPQPTMNLLLRHGVRSALDMLVAATWRRRSRCAIRTWRRT